MEYYPTWSRVMMTDRNGKTLVLERYCPSCFQSCSQVIMTEMNGKTLAVETYCPLCFQVMMMERYGKTPVVETYCPMCSQVMMTESRREKLHTRKEIFPCEGCGLVFTQLKNRKRHFTNVCEGNRKSAKSISPVYHVYQGF